LRPRARRCPDLIVVVRPGSDGPGRLGAQGAAAPSPEPCSAAGTSPGLVKQALRSLVWTAVWCKRKSAARAIYWGSDQGSTGVRAACATAQAALDRRRAAWCGRGRATATLSCANGPGGCGGAYRAWNRMGRWCRAAIGRTGGGARRGGASRTGRGRASPGLLRSRGSPGGALQGVEGFRAGQGHR
jgi:hypothetical protein